jgi:hypothetical protein
MLKKLRAFFSKQNAVDVQSALNLPLESPDVLDLLWSAYIESKDSRLVRRIISVLDGEDVVRDKMENWLANLIVDDSDASPTRKLLANCAFSYQLRDETNRRAGGS